MSADPKCSTCAYRVFERRAFYEPGFVAGATMVCLHPQVGRSDCANARLSPGAQCGPNAVLWVPHAETVEAEVQRVLDRRRKTNSSGQDGEDAHHIRAALIAASSTPQQPDLFTS